MAIVDTADKRRLQRTALNAFRRAANVYDDGNSYDGRDWDKISYLQNQGILSALLALSLDDVDLVTVRTVPEGD